MIEISVVVPTHNRSGLMIKHLRELAQQSLPPEVFEVIVVADGCTDDTVPSIRSLDLPFYLDVLEQKPAEGAAGARNRGAAVARADVLLFLDDDMEPLPKLLEAHLAAHNFQSGGVVLGYYPMQPPEPHESVFTKSSRLWWMKKFAERSDPNHRFTFWDFCTGNVSVARNAFYAAGGFEELIDRNCAGEDYELGYRLIKNRVPFQYVPEAASVHHATISWKKSLARTQQEGFGQAITAAKHPELFFAFNLSRLSRLANSTVLRPVWVALWKAPRLSEPPAALLQLVANVFLAANVQSQFRKLEGILRGHAYWKGVVAAMGTLSKYERLAQDAPFEPITCREFDFDISTDLPNLDEFVYEHSPIDALRVSAAGRPVGRIAPYAPGEALRAPHIKHLLVSCFGSSVLAELATRNQLSDGVPVYRSAVMQVSPSKTEDELRSPNSGSLNEKSRRPSFLARAVQSIRAPLNAVVSADAPEGFPAGHFYSPIARLTDVVRREQKIFEVPASLAGIDLNDKGQVSTITALARHFPAIHLSEQKQPGARFYYDNPNYGHGEALIYSSFLRELRPQRIVEIGSGFSTLLMLDTLEQIAATETQCICIEPYPELLLSLLGPSDIGRIEIHACEAQDASLQWFDGLDESDILFIDSTHVSKVGSDVHRLLFEVLPRLRAGVFVHFHDIFYPFEYPREWIFQGRNWNECYILRAFLQYNRDFSIVCFNSYLGKFHSELFCESKPLFLGNPGSSLWLRKL